MHKREGTQKPEKEKEEGQIDADLHFVMTTHTPENAKACAEELKRSGDIIALEAVGADKEWRDAMVKLVNQVSSLPEGDERRELEKKIGERFVLDPFYRDIFMSMAGSGKRIELIDIAREDPEWEIFSDADESDKGITQKLLFESFEDAYSAYCQFIDDFAEAVEAREKVVVRQLGEIAEGQNHPRISVFVGAAHTAPYIEMRKGGELNGTRTRKFVPESSEDGKKQTYSYKVQAMRQRRFFKDKEVPRTIIERAMLEHLVLGLVPSVAEMDSDRATQEGYILEILGAMTDEAMLDALNKIEHIKKKYVSFSDADDEPNKDFSEYENELTEYLESLFKK